MFLFFYIAYKYPHRSSESMYHIYKYVQPIFLKISHRAFLLTSSNAFLKSINNGTTLDYIQGNFLDPHQRDNYSKVIFLKLNYNECSTSFWVFVEIIIHMCAFIETTVIQRMFIFTFSLRLLNQSSRMTTGSSL